MATFGTFADGVVLTAAELNTAGEWSSYTPTLTQSVTVTKTVNWARYTKLNKLVIGSVKVTATGAGTADNAIKIGLPVNASSDNYLLGTGFFATSATATHVPLLTMYDTASTVVFRATSATDSYADLLGTTNFVDGGRTLANDTVIWFQFMYEAA